MTGIDTPIPMVLILLWGLAASGSILAYLGYVGRLRPMYLAGLAGARVLSSVLILLLLLQPYALNRTPDTTNHEVVLLADTSASMQTVDCDGAQSRMASVQDALADEADSLGRRLSERYRLKTYVFAETAQRFYGKGAPDIRPGTTALGDVLQSVTTRRGGRNVAAVLVLSDGNSNTGTSVLTVAQGLAQRGIPVSCVGIGELGQRRDIAAETVQKPIEAVKREDVSIPVTLSSTFGEAVETRVHLYRGDLEVASRAVTLPAGPSTLKTSFHTLPIRSGVHTYRIRVETPDADTRSDNDVAYATVEMRDPDTFRVLLLGYAPGWDHKFLRMLTDRDEQLTLATIVRLSEKRFHRAGEFPPHVESPEGFPEEAEFLNAHDVIVTDARAVAALSEKGRAGLLDFVDRRGGGLVLNGAVTPLPDNVARMLPVDTVDRVGAGRQRYLDIRTGLVYAEDAVATLTTPPGPFMPTQRPVFVSESLKPGARPEVTLAGTDKAVLSVQQYGSGRVAFLGANSTWEWHLASDADRDRYVVFWRNLLVWLASGGNDRIRAEFEGTRVAVQESTELAVDIRDATFRSAADADVSVVIRGPDNDVHDVRLAPSVKRTGNYNAFFTPAAAGEYKGIVQAEFGDGTAVQQDVYFVAQPGGAEMRDVNYSEGTLRDLARLTGGQFVEYRNMHEVRTLPLAASVPSVLEKHHWTNTWIFLAILLVSLSSEWYLRRRIGLK